MSAADPQRYVSTSALAAYARSDVGLGRCRLPRASLDALGLRLGSIVLWAVGEHRVVCTAWPDSSNSLQAGEVCIDATVFLGATAATNIKAFGACKFIKSWAPRVGSSVHASSKRKRASVSLAMLHGLPLLNSCVVAANPRLGRAHPVFISTVQPGDSCLAGLGTIVVNTSAVPSSPASSSAAPAPHFASASASTPRCRTSVVSELLRSIVQPALHLPPWQQCHGVLLLGPPGVGKSFAVRGVQQAARAWGRATGSAAGAHVPMRLRVRVRVCEVGVAALLVAEDPLAHLAALLASDDGDEVGEGEGENEGEGEGEGGGEGEEWGGVRAACVRFLVLDEADALGRPGAGQSDTQAALVQMLCAWLDAQGCPPSSSPSSSPSPLPLPLQSRRVSCCLVATTNHAAQVDPRLRRGGRLEREVEVAVTSEDRRVLLEGLVAHALGGGEGARLVATEAAAAMSVRTGGYVAADIAALVAEAFQAKEQLDPPLPAGPTPSSSSSSSSSALPSPQAAQLVSRLSAAMAVVRPSALRGATVTLPALTYADVVGHDEVKCALRRVLAFCSSDPDVLRRAERLGLTSAGGVLLHGPPGNSKTRLVMAVAASHALPVISLSSADVYSPYVGDAEAEVRRAFRLARQAAPCVLFLDEMDALVTDRGSGAGGSSGGEGGVSVEARVLATLLTEMDGIDGKHGVIVLGATNRVDCIDAALLRKGRFHHLLFVPLPDAPMARQLLCFFAAKCPAISPERVEAMLSELRPGLSGAEIESIVREESMTQMREQLLLL